MATEKKRTLEEFLSFSKKPERSDYVTAPEYDKEFVGDRPVMKKEGDKSVFKRSSGTLTKDASGKEVAEMEPLNAEGVIKEEAQAPREKILPPVEPEAPAPEFAAPYQPEAPAPAPQKKEPQETGPNVWERLLIGATPALVGLVTGNELEGLSLSGQTLVNGEADLYKREKDFNSKLREMKAKRDLAATTGPKTNYQMKELFDPKSKKSYVHSIINGRDAGVLGEASVKAGKDSFVKSVMRNPQTGKMEVATINPKTQEVNFHGEANVKEDGTYMDLDFQGTPTKAFVKGGKVENYVGKLPEKPNFHADAEAGKQQRFADQKTIDAFKMFAGNNSQFNKMKENLDGIVMAADQLNLGNPRANSGLQNFLARNIYGEKGPLSDSDLARLAGDPSYGAVIERFLDARLEGKLGELDRTDIRQILDLAYKVQVDKMMGEASRFGSGYKALGYDPTPGIQAYVKGAIRGLPEHKKLTAGNRTLESQTVMMERDGIQIPVPKARVGEMEKLGAKRVK